MSEGRGNGGYRGIKLIVREQIIQCRHSIRRGSQGAYETSSTIGYLVMIMTHNYDDIGEYLSIT